MLLSPIFEVSAHYDPADKIHAITYLQEHQAEGEVVTGLLYVERTPV